MFRCPGFKTLMFAPTTRRLHELPVAGLLALTALLAGCAAAPAVAPPPADAPRPIAREAPPQRSAPETASRQTDSSALAPAPEIVTTEERETGGGATRPGRSRNIFFLPGSAAISDEGRKAVAEISGKLNADRRLKVLLIGHANESGSNEYCVAVAAKRTSAVRAELLKRGIPVHQIRRRELGCEPVPQDRCRPEDCEQAQRRVELQLVEPERPHLTIRPRKR